jgi:hypothetical protein
MLPCIHQFRILAHINNDNIEKELFYAMTTRQGVQNKDQTREQVEKHDQRNDVELGSEFQIGNTKGQSQKKSGRQINKKKS